MNAQDAILTRRSVRSYKNEIISGEDFDKILLAAQQSPVTGGNHKTMELSVVENQEILEEISNYLKKEMNFPVDPFYGAKKLVVLSGRTDVEEPALYTNAGAMLENMQISANDLGLGSCIIWGCGEVLNGNDELKKKIQISDGFKTLAGFIVGYSDKKLPERVVRENYVVHRIK